MKNCGARMVLTMRWHHAARLGRLSGKSLVSAFDESAALLLLLGCVAVAILQFLLQEIHGMFVVEFLRN